MRAARSGTERVRLAGSERPAGRSGEKHRSQRTHHVASVLDAALQSEHGCTSSRGVEGVGDLVALVRVARVAQAIAVSQQQLRTTTLTVISGCTAQVR